MTYANLTRELKSIKKDLSYIKKHMVDVDSIITPKEERELEKALEEHRKGKTMTLDEFEKTID